MTTQNPRVAGYIPTDLHDRFKSFKEDRGIKGDSQALALMMAEFFGVSHQVAQKVDYSSFVTHAQFNELATKVSELARRIECGSSESGLLSKLPGKMRQIAERLERVEAIALLPQSSEASPDSDNISTVPGQMNFLDAVQGGSLSGLKDESSTGDSGSDPESELPSNEKWMSTKGCWEYLGRPGSYDTFRKLSPEKLHQLYGVAADLKRKEEGKYSAQWLSPPISQASQENQGNLPVDSSDSPV